jgi:hypothetical protein
MLPKSHLTSLAATSGCDLACQGLGRGLCVAEDDHFLSTKHIMRNRDERSSHQLCHSSLGKLGKNHNGCLRMAACGKEKSLHLLSHSDLGTPGEQHNVCPRKAFCGKGRCPDVTMPDVFSKIVLWLSGALLVPTSEMRAVGRGGLTASTCCIGGGACRATHPPSLSANLGSCPDGTLPDVFFRIVLWLSGAPLIPTSEMRAVGRGGLTASTGCIGGGA